MLNLSSELPCWEKTAAMLYTRSYFGVVVIEDRIYAVGGYNGGSKSLACAEVFNCSTQKWCMISDMSIRRGEVMLELEC
eukprot:XP_016663876.1 PREDICTED: kelch-like protein 3 [Acyrthosiphon pisum]